MTAVLVIDGSPRKDSSSRKAAQYVTKLFIERNAEVEFFRQDKTPLPLFDGTTESEQNENVQSLLVAVTKADVIVLSSPEYHNSMSAALKNALDWLTVLDHPFNGKVIGLMGGGGSMGNSGAITQMMMSVRAIHGWIMPEVFFNVPVIWNAFDDSGKLKSDELRVRAEDFVVKLLRYGELFKEHIRPQAA